MNAIQSGTPVGETLLTINIPIHINANTGQIVSDVNDAFSSVISQASDALRNISAPLDDYFGNLGDEIQGNIDSITSGIQGINWADAKSITSGLQPILGYLKPVWEFVAQHPQVLAIILIPVLEIFLAILGFSAAGVVAGSVAAILMSHYGNVPKGSLYSFFQSAGARGWAYRALESSRPNMVMMIVVIMVAVAQELVEQGIIDPNGAGMEGAWNSTAETFDPPTTKSASSRTTVLNLDVGWVRYGIWAWLLMYGAILAGAY